MCRWATDGSVRGSCGHSHDSPEEAWECLCADQAACQAQGGYSDRVVLALEQGAEEAPRA